jgi:hypothetical protein
MQATTSFCLASGSTWRVSYKLAIFEVQATKKLSNESSSVTAHLYVESQSPKLVTFSASVKQLCSELAEQVSHCVVQLSTHAESEIKFSVSNSKFPPLTVLVCSRHSHYLVTVISEKTGSLKTGLIALTCALKSTPSKVI